MNYNGKLAQNKSSDKRQVLCVSQQGGMTMNQTVHIPYGKTHLPCSVPYTGLLTSRVGELKSDRAGIDLVREAMANPIGRKHKSEIEE